MKANELRIGNFINPVVNGLVIENEIHIVEPSTLMMIQNVIDNRGITFVPIPLTEKWLLKFGFENTNTYRYSKLSLTGENTHITIDGYFAVNSGYLFNANIKYVHQLQNLYFALTGEELLI